MFFTKKGNLLRQKVFQSRKTPKKNTRYNVLFIMPEIINNDIIRRLAEIIDLLQKKSIGIIVLTSYIDTTRRYFDKNLDIIVYKKLNNAFLFHLFYFPILI